MVDRSIAVRLSLQDNYSAGIRRAGQATDDFARKGEAAGRSAKRAQGGLAGMGGVLPGVSTGALALGAGVAYAGKTFLDFEKAMSGVRANVDATPAQFAALTEAVKRSGTQFGFSASESAAATEDLAKAGLTAQQIMGGGLSGALTLAAAGSVSTGRAAEVAATAMTMFGKKASDVGHIADVLSNGANKSTASVDSLAMGMQQGGMQAAQMGMSLEDTVATLAAFDQAGLKGSDAGTSLKTMLTALANPSKAAAEMMSQLGINAFDASGKFVGMQSLADQLKGSLGGLSQEQRNAALSTIFGADASRAAAVAMGLSSDAAKTGGKSFSTWAAEMQKSGTAAENARTRTDNLAGDLRKLKSAADNALISLGQSGSGPLREFVQMATGAIGVVGSLVSTLGKVPGPVLAIAAAMTAGRLANNRWGESLNLGGRVSGATSNVRAFTGALGEMSRVQRVNAVAANGSTVALSGMAAQVATLGGAGSTLERMSTTFTTTAASASRLPRATGAAAAGMVGLRAGAVGLAGAMGGPLGIGIAAVGVGLSMLAARQQQAAQRAAEHRTQVDALAAALQADGGAMGNSTRATIADALAKDKAYESAKRLGISVQELTLAAQGHKPAQDAVNAAIAKNGMEVNKVIDAQGRAVPQGMKMSDAAKTVKGAVEGQTGAMREAKGALETNRQAMAASAAEYDKQKASASGAKDSTISFAAAQEKAAKSAASMVEQLSKVKNAFLQLQGGQIGYEAAIDSATKSIAEHGRTLNIDTEAGRANKQALIEVANQSQQLMASMAENGASATSISAKYASMRAQLIQTAQAMGMSASEAKSFADQALLIPSSVKTTVTAETAAATAALSGLKKDAVTLSGKTVTIKAGALNAEQTKAVLAGVEGARKNANGSVSIPTTAPNANVVRKALEGVTSAAVTADGKVVTIPASTPNAAAVKKLLEGVSGAAVSADGKRVSIPVAAPNSPQTKALLNSVEGAALSADKKSVSVPTSALGAVTAKSQINGVIASANAANGKTATVTITTRQVTEIWTRAMGNMNPWGRDGGNVMSLPVGQMPRHARGNAVIDGVKYGFMNGLVGGAVKGPGSGTSDQVLTASSRGLIRTANGEHILTAREVAQAGGHEAIYRLRAGIRSGAIRGFASGGGVDDWSPDMSGIMAFAQSLKVDPSALTDQRKRVKDQTTALTKATRDLKAARDRLARSSVKSRVAAENAVATAIERQAKASRDLAASRSKLSGMESRAGQSAGRQFIGGISSSNWTNKRFLDDIERIKKRGFPLVARSLLEDGSDSAVKAAHDLAAGKISELRVADAGLKFSDKQADRKAALLSELQGSSALTASARQQANAQLLAMRGANMSAYYSSGPMQVSTAALEAKFDALAAAVTDISKRPLAVTSTVELDRQVVGRSVAPVVMAEASRQDGYGRI